MSTEEKRKLGAAIAELSSEDISKALEIVAQSNPGFQAVAEEVDLDIDAQVIIYNHIRFDVSIGLSKNEREKKKAIFLCEFCI